MDQWKYELQGMTGPIFVHVTEPYRRFEISWKAWNAMGEPHWIETAR